MWTGIIALLIANFLASSINPTFVKLGVKELPPFTFSALRFLIATLFFLPVFLKMRSKFDRKQLPYLIKITLFFPANIILYAVAIQYTTAVMTQILYGAVPIVVGFIVHFILGEKLSRNKLIGAAISMCGISFLLYSSFVKQDVTSLGSLKGNLLCLVAVLCWSMYFSYSKRLMKYYSPVTTSFFSYVFTAVISLLIVPIELSRHPVNFGHISPITWFSVGIVGIGGSAVMYYLMQQGIKRVGPFGASLFQYLAPVFGALTAIPILHEHISPQLAVGSVLILTGVFYATTYEQIARRKRKNLV